MKMFHIERGELPWIKHLDYDGYSPRDVVLTCNEASRHSKRSAAIKAYRAEIRQMIKELEEELDNDDPAVYDSVIW